MPPVISIDDSAAIVRAAEAGDGLALARWSLVADDVQRGRLAIASKNVTPNGRDYYFVCPPKHCGLPKVAAFHTWLRAEAARQPAPGAC
jgi:DNA-binding transcriptional LysR family regulator